VSFLKFPHFPVKLGLFWGPRFFFYWNPPIFVTKEPMQKFETLRQPLMWF
jgi:hypothetical protein